MKQTVRALGVSDIASVRELLASRQVEMWESGREEEEQLFLEFLPAYLEQEDGMRLLVGSFKGGRLTAMAGSRLWQSMPHWSLLNVKTHHDFGQSFLESGLPFVLEFLVQEMEKLGRLKYYYMTKIRSQGVYSKMISQTHMQRVVPLLRRYDFVTESVLRVGEVARYRYEEVLTSKLSFPHDIFIRSGTLREVYRTQLLSRFLAPDQIKEIKERSGRDSDLVSVCENGVENCNSLI